MSTKKWLFAIVMIGLFSQSFVGAQEAEKMPLDTTKVRIDKIDKKVYSELEDVEIRGMQKGKIPLAKELLPDDKLIWTRTFEGRMTDCAIAEKSGHVVIGGAKDWQGFVYLFGPDGQLLWKKESSINSDIKKCGAVVVDISNNGRTIGVVWFGDYEDANTQVYDVSGERTLDLHAGAEIGSHVTVSPGGGYVDCDWGLLARDGKKIELRKILQGIPQMKPREHFDAVAFASDSELVVQIEGISNLYFFSFPDGQLKWKRATEKFGRIATSENYVLLSGLRNVILFNKKGNLLWTKTQEKIHGVSALSFFEDEDYIGIYRQGRCDGILVLNTKTGEIEHNINFAEGCIEQFPPYFVCLNDLITVSGITGAGPENQGKREGYHVYFFKFSSDRKIIDKGWRKGLVIGTSTSSFIGVYESDATDRHPAFGDNSTQFTINVLERRRE